MNSINSNDIYYLTPKQVADLTCTNIQTVYRRLRDGLFPNVRRKSNKSGSDYLIPATDVVAYVKGTYRESHLFSFDEFVYWAGVVRPSTLEVIRGELDWSEVDAYLADHPTAPNSDNEGENGLDEWEQEDQWLNEFIGLDHERWARRYNSLFRQDPFITLPCAHGCSYEPTQAVNQSFEDYVIDRYIECNVGDIAELMIRDYLDTARKKMSKGE